MKSQLPVYILTGMHRSGTSLIARFLSNSGINMGEKLLGPHPSNPYGHYEDMDILNFQVNVLRRENNGEDQWVSKIPNLTNLDRLEASQIISNRRLKNCPWGWKEPRTCLFLRFWESLIPNAQFVFVFRHPQLVHDSLCRRHNISNRRTNSKFLRSWIFYNAQLLQFYKDKTHKCTFFSIENAVKKPEEFVLKLSDRLDYPFMLRNFELSFDSSLLRRKSKQPRRTNLILTVRSYMILRRLQKFSLV